MNLPISIKKQVQLIKYFRQDEKDNFIFVEVLLYCVTYCHPTGIISLEAFNLLDIIFNGSLALNVDHWKLLEQEKNKLNFYTNMLISLFLIRSINIADD